MLTTKTIINPLLELGLNKYEAKVYLTLVGEGTSCLLYTSPSPRDRTRSRMPSSA